MFGIILNLIRQKTITHTTKVVTYLGREMLKIDTYLDIFLDTKFSNWYMKKKMHNNFVNNDKTKGIKK